MAEEPKKSKRGGARPGAGRKSKAELLGLPALLEECWTDADRRATLRALAAKASKGDMEAIKLLMAYAYGKPTERKEVSGPSGGPIEIVVQYEEDI